MCSVSDSSSSAVLLRSGRSGDASVSGRPARRWFPGLRPSAFKPLTYSAMHFCVAITVAYALTQDWRIALGLGVIEPMVQTVAYMVHEKVWSCGSRTSVDP
jgi:uncharacterized membrane protein